jgi:FkbM family methyltransferase
MLETLHRLGSALRHSPLLARQDWLWNAIEPAWQRAFAFATRSQGFEARINGETLRLAYEFAARYDRADKRVYEPSFYAPFAAAVRPGATVFDIGAHIGIFALGAAKRAGESGRVFAFEPSPETAAVLRRHVELNGFERRVEVIPSVVSNRTGTASFYSHHLSMAASLSRANIEDFSPEDLTGGIASAEVPCVTLDEFCERGGVWPSVIKIDVEGAELLVLEGARSLLAGRGDRQGLAVFCEIHPLQMKNCGSSLADFRALVSSVGYKMSQLDEPNPAGIFHAAVTKEG